jgi:hypothetical protein
MTSPQTPSEQFEAIAGAHERDPGVTRGTGFGATAGLRISGKIFAMLLNGQLVVKLPPERVTELENGGAGQRLGTGRGRPYREWIALRPDAVPWPDLASEAYTYVSGLARR